MDKEQAKQGDRELVLVALEGEIANLEKLHHLRPRMRLPQTAFGGDKRPAEVGGRGDRNRRDGGHRRAARATARGLNT